MTVVEHMVDAPGSPAPTGPYSQAVTAGDLTFISRQLAIDPASGVLVTGGIDAQSQRALDNVEAILTAVHSSWADVASARSFWRMVLTPPASTPTT